MCFRWEPLSAVHDPSTICTKLRSAGMGKRSRFFWQDKLHVAYGSHSASAQATQNRCDGLNPHKAIVQPKPRRLSTNRVSTMLAPKSSAGQTLPARTIDTALRICCKPRSSLLAPRCMTLHSSPTWHLSLLLPNVSSVQQLSSFVLRLQCSPLRSFSDSMRAAGKQCTRGLKPSDLFI